MEPFIKGFAQDAPEPTVPPSEYLTVEEVAHLLRLSESAIYRALREHRLPGLKILGRWRIPRAELAEQNGRGGATPARGETISMTWSAAGRAEIPFVRRWLSCGEDRRDECARGGLAGHQRQALDPSASQVGSGAACARGRVYPARELRGPLARGTRQKTKTFPRRRDAERFDAEVKRRLDIGERAFVAATCRRAPRSDSQSNGLLGGVAKRGGRARDRDRFREAGLLDKYILPELGHLHVIDLRPARLDAG